MAALGAWLRLYGRAAEIEHAGVLPGTLENDARAWMFEAGVTPEEVAAVVSAGLAVWRGSDLVLHGYDVAGQRRVETKRRIGETGGRRKLNDSSAEKPIGSQVGQPSGLQSGKPLSSPLLSLPEEIRAEGDPEPPPAVTTTEPDLWPAHVWQRRFGLAWVAAKANGVGTLGGGTEASKASGDLSDQLASLPRTERLAAQARAGAMFAEYLGDDSQGLVKARWPWKWFVQRFDGLRLAPPVAPRGSGSVDALVAAAKAR